MNTIIRLGAIGLTLALSLTSCSKKPSADGKEVVPATPAADKDKPTTPAPVEQSFAEAMAHICGAPSAVLPALDDVHDASRKAAKLAEYIEDGLSNAEAKELFSSLATMASEEKLAAMKEAAARAGIEECELLGVWTPVPDHDHDAAP